MPTTTTISPANATAQGSSSAEMNKFQKSDSNSSVGSNSTTSSSLRNEWRRKSYGFEKMTPPPDTTMSHNCMESSTDSGIGRSGGDLTNQHQVQGSTAATASAANSTKNGTIVHISNPAVDNYQSYRSSFRNSLNSTMATDNPKRHSIAVADDRRYLSENLKDSSLNKPQASVNGFNVIFNNSATTNAGFSVPQPSSHQQQQSNSKRVEFCKTEVHFAPESGRVNIVETDGKPPPTNNFRRRRSSTQYLSQSSSTESDYGVEADQQPPTTAQLSNCDQGKSLVEIKATTEEEVRGILKNKPVKPKPYHLGENCADGESLFGVRLRPVSGDYTNWMPKPSNPSISLYKEPDSGECLSGGC